MTILGLSFFYHDAAAALIVDGLPVALAEEERFSRKKHDSNFPQQAINFVLNRADLTPQNIDYIVFYEKPFIKLERIMKTNLATFPAALPVFIESNKHLFKDLLWVRAQIASVLVFDPQKIFFSHHHFSHAASSFFCSPFEQAAILTIDGVGEWATTTIAEGRGNNIKTLKEIRFPHSLGLFYSAFTSFLGFEVNDGEYKVMGMAPFGAPRYVTDVKKMIRFFEDGSYELDLSYFAFQRSLKKMYSEKFVRLFGPPRDPRSNFFTAKTVWPSYFDEQPGVEEFLIRAREQEHYADIACSLQAVLEESVCRLAQAARKLTGLDQLCLAGGVALNSVANAKIIKKTPCQNIYIQPAAGDAGGALGAALGFYSQALAKPRSFIMKRADYGVEFNAQQIERFLTAHKIKFEFIINNEVLVKKVAETLVTGKVIGWFQGRAEWGPRALGQRSILADPRNSAMKDTINVKIKFREPYRPFAPSVLAEYANEYFMLPAQNNWPARFMLLVVPVIPEKRALIPAVVHVDGSARPQLVYRAESPLFYQLIDEFHKLTGIPLVLNTSFNLKGEPIVNTPADAYETFLKSGLDVLVLGNYYIEDI